MFPLPYTLGDYTLVRLLKSDRGRYIYEAEQITTSRKVLLEMPDEAHQDQASVDNFLEEARLKTTVIAPYIPVAYEASKNEGVWHFSYEFPEGTLVIDLLANGTQLQALSILNLLQVLGEATVFFRKKELKTLPLGSDMVLIDPSGNVRILNPVVVGSLQDEVDPDHLVDVKRWGEIIPQLITPGMHAATRLSTIAQWMREGHQGQPFTWEQVLKLVDTVKDQLLQENAATKPVPTKKSGIYSTKNKVLAGIILCAVGLMGYALTSGDSTAEAPQVTRPQKPNFANRDHTMITLKLKNGQELRCDAHEVTIDAYKRFLDSLDRMPSGTEKNYAHPDQPASKTSHKPSDWDNMLSAAKHNRDYQGHVLSLRSPVFMVDFWDAYAYAKWKGHRLPTLDEWREIAETYTIDEQGDPFCSVDGYNRDVAKKGICGLNSGVSEWTSTTMKDPAAPPSEPDSHMISGGNYNRPSHTDEPRFAPTPNLKEATLGFRTVR